MGLSIFVENSRQTQQLSQFSLFSINYGLVHSLLFSFDGELKPKRSSNNLPHRSFNCPRIPKFTPAPMKAPVEEVGFRIKPINKVPCKMLGTQQKLCHRITRYTEVKL